MSADLQDCKRTEVGLNPVYPVKSAFKNLKVLVSAYACEPDKGSEPGVGWNWAKQIARFHEAWVITRTNNRPAIDKALATQPDPNLHFIYVDPPKWLTFWKRKQRGVRTYYYLWQIAAYFNARALMKQVKFDLAHHVTFVNDWLPAGLALLHLPFIWGPIGSHPHVPAVFMPNRKALLLETMRQVVQMVFRTVDPFFYITMFRARRIIMIDRHLVNTYPFTCTALSKFQFQPAIAIDRIAPSSGSTSGKNDLALISVGRLLYIKGFHLAVAAFAEAAAKHGGMVLAVIGDGAERSNLERLAEGKGAREKVAFRGNIPLVEVYATLGMSDIFIFPSFEGGGMVVLEAMASGLPVICLDYGGPGQMVTDECGIKIKPINPEQTIRELADAILTLAGDSELRLRMGEAGRRRVQEVYSWDKKGEFIQKVYQEVLKREGSSPS